MAAFPAGTIVGPVTEVHIVKFHDGYAIEVSISSICKHEDTSYVVNERFVNDKTHDHKADFRSSDELLGDLSVLVDLTTKSANKLVVEPGLCSQFSICLFQLSLHCVRLERVETLGWSGLPIDDIVFVWGSLVSVFRPGALPGVCTDFCAAFFLVCS